MPFRPRPALGMLMVLVSGLLFALNGTVSKLILRGGVSAPDLTTLRALGACLGLVALGAALRPGWRRFRVTAGQLPLLIAYGLTGFLGVPMLYFVAISRMPVGIALLFEYTAPLLVALWARFGQHQPVRPRLWAGLALCLLGLACVAEVWGDLHLDGLGLAAGLGAAALLACYYIFGAKGVSSRDTVSLTGWAFGVSAVAGLAFRLVTGAAPDWSALGGHTAGGTPLWLLAAYLLVLGTIVPYLLVAGALRHLPATSVGILGMVEPVFATAAAWLVLGEWLNPAQLAGGALVLAGVVLAETARMPAAPPAPAARLDSLPERRTIDVSPSALGQNETHVAPERDRSPARP
ncbi:permease [Catellatospora sp. TT07R-123]|uniref:EamA family transporter n=1 Tax=Catellatospora sp. TT07R-123 TaxID=2733863 RepID=UPI001B1BE7D2|nr:DMT family transporter [Catellatospora sp. TT07R-123]GHJ44981.1 permease [Catellatospora sp. TT07R-123]